MPVGHFFQKFNYIANINARNKWGVYETLSALTKRCKVLCTENNTHQKTEEQEFSHVMGIFPIMLLEIRIEVIQSEMKK